MRVTATAVMLAGLAMGNMAYAQATEQAAEPVPDTAPTETEATTVPADPTTSDAVTTEPAPAEVMPEADAPATGSAPAIDPAPVDATTATEADAAGTAMAPAAFAVPEGYNAIELGSVTAEELKGVDIYDATDSDVAEVADLVLGADGMVTGVVTDVGGFLGMGEHRISLAPDQISFYRNADGDLRGYVSLSKDQMKAMPAYVAPAG